MQHPQSPDSRRPRTAGTPARWEALFAGFTGGFLGLALLKFGNPIIFERLVPAPQEPMEVLFQAWPTSWGYWGVVLVVFLGLKVGRWRTDAAIWVWCLPLVWLGWQCISALQTVDWRLTKVTVVHFWVCAAFFYLGLFGLSNVRRLLTPFWVGLLIGFIGVLWSGFGQHYGGLEATRRYVYEHTDWQQMPPEYLKKLASNRIFGTLVYPNSLAGVILLLSPVMLLTTWMLAARLGRRVRLVCVGLLAYSSLACLFWSGSKAGWLIALVMGLVALLHLPGFRISNDVSGAANETRKRPFHRQAHFWFITGLLVIGLTGFFVRFAAYFKRGATSVGARFDYWRAGLETARSHFILGTGPGTFGIAYKQIKASESEMARLTHNDFLEQASDSGIIGFLSYSGWILGSVWFLYRYRFHSLRGRGSWFFVVWLGFLGWVVQSFVEFNLYIPALSWPAFLLVGWLWGQKGENTVADSNLTSIVAGR
jgi:O-antigen ligase